MELLIPIIIFIIAANIFRPPVQPSAPMVITIEPQQPEHGSGGGAILLAILAVVILLSLLAI